MRVRSRVLTAGALAAGLLIAASLARAADGVIEINQARALAGGIAPGDTPGYPITIDRSGSYRLSGALDLTAEPRSKVAIIVFGSSVTIDLGGFEIVGPASCTGTGPSLDCGAPDVGHGIASTLAHDLEIRNGRIRNMAGAGILTANGSSITDVIAVHNATDGVNVQEGSLIRGCIARENGEDGFDVDGGSALDDVAALANGDDGIEIDGRGTVVAHSAARANGGYGISTVEAASLSDCAATDNALYQVRVGGWSTIENCAIVAPTVTAPSLELVNAVVTLRGSSIFGTANLSTGSILAIGESTLDPPSFSGGGVIQPVGCYLAVILPLGSSTVCPP